MPGNYYCLDNFFQKLTDMESPRKNNDCYFYYYSTCTKGDSCTFRHEPSALGCETTCSFWKEGKCFNVQCNFRHMELRKNRKVIPCYWETQPGGCLKPHCPFLHQNPKHLSHSDSQGEPSDIKTQELNKQSAIQKTDSCAKNASQGNEKSFGNPVVDPLVVNFEEESDNESAPTQSPIKTSRSVKVKTLEEIRLEKVQAESAAYYSYPGNNVPEDNGDDLRERIVKRLTMKQEEKRKDINTVSIGETRRRKRFAGDAKPEENFPKKQKISLSKGNRGINNEFKIKTLDEIRAERAKKISEIHIPVSSSNEDRLSGIASDTQDSEDSEVSSTSKIDDRKETVEDKSKEMLHVAKIQPIKRLKRSRSADNDKDQGKIRKLDTDVGVSKEHQEVIGEEQLNADNTCDKPINKHIETETKVEINLSDDLIAETESVQENKVKKHSEISAPDTNRLDEVLLLDEVDFDEHDMIKAEDDILKDIDDLLNE